MAGPVIWAGSVAKNLLSGLQLGSNATIYSGNIDPSSVATTGSAGDIYLSTSTNSIYIKTDSGSTTNWTKQVATNSGDITSTSFSAANNQVAAANVTGLSFANATVRSFRALVSVYVNATSSLYESFTLQGIQRGSDWQMSVTTVGDASGFTFSITTAGQVQYTDSNYSGFVSATVKFSAIALPV